MCNALTFRGREGLVQQYTPAVWRLQVAWDTCWRERDYDVLGEQLRADWSDTPRTAYTTVRLTWGQIRTWVREEIAGKREEARFCSMRCRQASSRHALRARKVPR